MESQKHSRITDSLCMQRVLEKSAQRQASARRQVEREQDRRALRRQVTEVLSAQGITYTDWLEVQHRTILDMAVAE